MSPPVNAYRNAIELDWFGLGSALDVARRYPDMTRSMVCGYWNRARAAGRLPNIGRPAGGFPWEQLLAARAQAQALNSIPPISAEATATRLKEVA